MRILETGSGAVGPQDFIVGLGRIDRGIELDRLTGMRLDNRIHLPSTGGSSDDSVVQEFLVRPKGQLVDEASGNLLPLVESRTGPVCAQVVNILHTASVPLRAAPGDGGVE